MQIRVPPAVRPKEGLYINAIQTIYIKNGCTKVLQIQLHSTFNTTTCIQIKYWLKRCSCLRLKPSYLRIKCIGLPLKLLLLFFLRFIVFFYFVPLQL